MAKGVDFNGSNKKYGPPDGVTEEQCATLHTFVNGACIVSAWELTDEELAEVMRTKRVFLSVWSGRTLFPVFVGSESVAHEVVADFGAVWPLSKQEPIASPFAEYQHAVRLAETLHAKHFADNKDWKPAPTLIEVLDQIDNMTSKLEKPKPYVYDGGDASGYYRGHP